jgi:hypothetical protein
VEYGSAKEGVAGNGRAVCAECGGLVAGEKIGAGERRNKTNLSAGRSESRPDGVLAGRAYKLVKALRNALGAGVHASFDYTFFRSRRFGSSKPKASVVPAGLLGI